MSGRTTHASRPTLGWTPPRPIARLALSLLLAGLLPNVATANPCGDALPEKRAVAPPAPLVMVPLPETTFLMGSPVIAPGSYGGPWKVNEWPRHEVAVPAFEMQQTEVTVGEWVAFLQTVGHLLAWHPLQPVDYIDGQFVAAVDEDEPIRAVTWEEADAFCRWHGAALPTEAQWERATVTSAPVEPDGPIRDYVWGDEPLTCARANVGATYSPCAAGPMPVGSYSPDGDTEDGIADMIGNVGEWVDDGYAPYPGGPPPEQIGSGDDRYRVVRGGSYLQFSERSRRVARSYAPLTSRSVAVGFRCARAGSP